MKSSLRQSILNTAQLHVWCIFSSDTAVHVPTKATGMSQHKYMQISIGIKNINLSNVGRLIISIPSYVSLGSDLWLGVKYSVIAIIFLSTGQLTLSLGIDLVGCHLYGLIGVVGYNMILHTLKMKNCSALHWRIVL